MQIHERFVDDADLSEIFFNKTTSQYNQARLLRKKFNFIIRVNPAIFGRFQQLLIMS